MSIRERKDWEKIQSKIDPELTHQIDFVFLFQGGDKTFMSVYCFVEDRRADKTEVLYNSTVQGSSIYLLKGIFSHYNAVTMFNEVISPASFLYNKDFSPKGTDLCFYFKQYPDTRECVAVNPYTLLCAYIGEL